MDYSDLPTLNVSLNILTAVCLAGGYLQIRRGERRRHKTFMLGACCLSLAFLVSYVIYHLQVGSVRYEGEGWIRLVYFSILISHIVLAAAIVPLVVVTLRYALGGSFARHRQIARWTWPIWMYVSATGVVIYCMLYLG